MAAVTICSDFGSPQNCYVYMLLNASSYAQSTVRPNKSKCWSLDQKKVYCMAKNKETGDLCPQIPELLEGFQQSTFKGKLREVHNKLLLTSQCRNPLFLQLSTQVRSWCSPTGQILLLVLHYLYMNRLLKVRVWRIGYSIYSGYVQHSFTKGMSQHD